MWHVTYILQRSTSSLRYIVISTTSLTRYPLFVSGWSGWLLSGTNLKAKKKGGGSIPVTVIPSSALTFKYSRVFSCSFPPFFLPGFTWGQYPLNDRLACCMTSDGNKPGGGGLGRSILDVWRTSTGTNNQADRIKINGSWGVNMWAVESHTHSPRPDPPSAIYTMRCSVVYTYSKCGTANSECPHSYIAPLPCD